MATTILLVYCGFCLLLFLGQRRLLYFPVAEATHVPALDLRLQSDTETLKIWCLKNDSRSAVLYFGGNGEDVSWNVPFFIKHFSNHDIYLMNYRGYGGSTGSPTEKALFRDAVTLFDAVEPQYDKVAVVGRSLGSGVAVFLASERDIEKLVLVTPFDSIENLAKKSFAIFPISLLLKDKYDSLKRANKVTVPTLVVIAENDEMIPKNNTDALVAAMTRSSVKIKVLKSETHNFHAENAEYLDALTEYL